MGIDLYEEKYQGFGPTLASEKLLEYDSMSVKPETLRLWLKDAGLWASRRKRKQHRTRRTRRARFGELVQLDGSIHAWLDGVEGKQCLMNMVDDATGKSLAIMDTGETTRAAFALLKWWVRDAGIPMAIYVDLKSLYVSPKMHRYTEEDELVEPEWLTHFSLACKKLGIEIIKAYSPQAKGRVERKHAVYQDRLIKELKLKGISTIEGANKLLADGFVNKLNNKFAKPAHSVEDAHAPLSSEDDLKEILCWESTRILKNDWTLQFKNEFFQVTKRGAGTVRPKHKVAVREHLDGSVSLWHKDKRLRYVKISLEERKTKQEEEKITATNARRKKSTQCANQRGQNSPWRTFNPDWMKNPHGVTPVRGEQ